MASPARLNQEELAFLNRRFETAPARHVVEWAVDTFHPRLCITASMTDAVLIDIASRVRPGLEVVFLDTGYHFPETLDTAELVRRRYPVQLRVIRPEPPTPEPLWRVDPVDCCSSLKIALLERALADKDAWLTGLRRCESETRADAPIVHLDGRGLVKVNPIAAWSDDDVEGYIADHDVPVNPLRHRGYRSIGCQPCTRPAPADADARAGRWAGLDKTECGIHL